MNKVKSLVFFLWLFFFLFLNVFTSQTVSQIYFALVNNDRVSTVAFLKKIIAHPRFAFFLQMNKNIFNHSLENEVFADQKAKKEEISQLEMLLKKNQKSRDIIYRLYSLNKDMGNDQQAEKYLKLAKEIDPEIAKTVKE